MANSEDESSQQQSTICQRIKNLRGLVFVVLLFSVVLIKVLELSRDVEDSRRLLKELTNKLVKTQKENEVLRKQLGNTNAKVEFILRKFSSAQKVISREIDCTIRTHLHVIVQYFPMQSLTIVTSDCDSVEIDKLVALLLCTTGIPSSQTGSCRERQDKT